jgi:RNA polymerase sigma factor (sigma-70 family)
MKYDAAERNNLTLSSRSGSARLRARLSATSAPRRTLRPMDHAELTALARVIAQRRGHRVGLTPDERDDLLQDVLEKYLHTWPAPTSPDNPAAWLETATANAIIDRGRVAARRPAANFAAGEKDPISIVMSAMRSANYTSLPAISRELIDTILALLPVEEARLISRRYLDGHPAASLAAELGITVANLDQRTTRAKRRLQEALATRPDLVDELRRPHPHLY